MTRYTPWTPLLVIFAGRMPPGTRSTPARWWRADIVYVGSNDSRVYALDAANGHVRWYYTTGNSVISKPAAAGDSVYVGSGDDTVYALNTIG